MKTKTLVNYKDYADARKNTMAADLDFEIKAVDLQNLGEVEYAGMTKTQLRNSIELYKSRIKAEWDV